MIKSIELKNIQSHESSKLEFHKGVNCIVGSSNNGKSAILRGLYWARYNRPLGIDTLASHWVVDEKGNLKNEISVKVENENGYVIRKRTKTENQYIENGNVENVVKSDIPKTVEKILQLSDTNIQRQLDEPFLLSKSSGEVAKYFNHIVNLDVIDKVLTNAETNRRKAKNDIENTENLIKKNEEKLQNFDWLDVAEKLITKYENVTEKRNKIETVINLLEKQLNDYSQAVELSSKFNDVVNNKKKIEQIEKLQNDLSELAEAGKNLKSKIIDYENNQNKKFDFSIQNKLINDIEKIKLVDEFTEIENDLNRYKKECENENNQNKTIQELKRQLPDICPLCGNVMQNGICKNN